MRKGTTSHLELGAWLQYDDEDYQLVAIQGSSLHLRSSVGRTVIVLQSVLFTDPSFKLTELTDVQARAGVDDLGFALEIADADDAAGSSDEAEAAEGALLPEESLGLRAQAPWRRLDLDRAAFIERLPDEERKRIEQIERHLWDIISAGAGDGTDLEAEDVPGPAPISTLSERVMAKAKQIGTHERTVWRWYTAYTENGAGITGLVDKRKVRGSDPLANLDARVRKCVMELMLEEQEHSTGSMARFVRRLERRVGERYGPEAAQTIPTLRTMQRALTAMSKGKHTFGDATSRKSLDAQPDGVHGHITASRPGEVVMMDTTRLDAFAYDPESDTVMSVELSIALDLATRSIVAWRFTPVGSKAVDTVMLLTDVMAPKMMRPGWRDELRYSYMAVHGPRLLSLDERLSEAAAVPVVYPESILVDQGKSYDSNPVKAACQRLGVSHRIARKRKGTDKGEVERAFGTIRTGFTEHLDAFKGRSVAHRGKNPEELAHFTVAEIEEYFAEWVVAVYQRRPHWGLRLPGAPRKPVSPNLMYEALVAVAGFVPCPTDPNMYLELLPVSWKSIHKYGVNHMYLVYDDEAGVLDRYRETRSPYPDHHGKWPFRVDPRNLVHLYFKDPDDGAWHAIKWVGADSTVGPFSDRLVKHVRADLRAAGVKEPTQAELKETLAALQNRTDTDGIATKKGRRAVANERLRQRDLVRDQKASLPTAAPVREDRPNAEDLSKKKRKFDPTKVKVLDVYGGDSAEADAS